MRSRCRAVSSPASSGMPSPAKLDQLGRLWMLVGDAAAGADAGDEVHQHQVAAAAADLEAERERAVRVERVGHGGLADPSALALAGAQQAVGLEPVDRDRRGLRRQAGEPRDVHLGEAAVAADERQDQPLVVEAHPGLVGAATVSRLHRRRLRAGVRSHVVASHERGFYRENAGACQARSIITSA